MKKVLLCLTVLFIFDLNYNVPVQVLTNNLSAEEKDIPSYAKWGRLAMMETKKKYKDAQIIDYLHIGREKAGENSVEKFKLWLRGDNKEFGVFIRIEFNTETEEVISITFEETDR